MPCDQCLTIQDRSCLGGPDAPAGSTSIRQAYLEALDATIPPRARHGARRALTPAETAAMVHALGLDTNDGWTRHVFTAGLIPPLRFSRRSRTR